MKRKLGIAIAALTLTIAVIYIHIPDYQVVHDRNILTDQSREVELDVIIYKFWTAQSMAEEIATKHAQINGTPNSMVLKVYLSRYCLRKGYGPYTTISVNFY